MESEMREKIVALFEAGSSILKLIPRRKRVRIDEVEIVFVDSVNGKNKPRRATTFAEILEAVEDGSKPIGLIFIDWNDPERMESKEFSGISSDETQILMNAFAEAQDQQKDDLGEMGMGEEEDD